MKVVAMWEFDADVADLDPKFVNIPEQAKDLAKRELEDALARGTMTADDFEYVVVIE